MLTDKEIDDLLYAIPPGVEDDLIQEVDLEYIPKERIEKLIYIINHEKEFKFWQVYQAGCLLCYWGNETGFKYVERLILDKNIKEIRNIYLDNEDYEYILGSLQFYMARHYDLGKGELARKKIYPVVKLILTYAKDMFFKINFFYYSIEDGLYEYIPLIKDYLSCIIKNKKERYWDIYDASKLLLKLEPNFVIELFNKNGLLLSDFNLTPKIIK